MKNTFKKILAAISALLMLTSTFTGCSSADGKDLVVNEEATGAMYAQDTAIENESPMADAGAMDIDMKMAGMYEEGYIDFNTEEYNAIKENSFESVASNPLSTFSVDVDTASYTILRRKINSNEGIVKDAIRIEEMINYFDYDYTEPTGDVPFSVTAEMSDCPWNEESKLVLVGLQAEDIDEERAPLNLVFLIDISGSMRSSDKIGLVQEAFCILTESLDENDRVSIVTYAGNDDVVLEGESGDNKRKIKKAIRSLETGGATAGADGINTAYDIAEKYFIEGGNNRIILATDGDLNVGISSEAELTELVEEKRETGIFLSTMGFGSGNYKDNKMEALADNGNGSYSYIDSLLEAEKVLSEELNSTLYTVAKDVKLQVEFNPAYVKEYRLIGYENRALADKDFEDDTKDAGEIGAGHSVTAIYELISANGETDSELKYSEASSGIENGEIMTVSIRYKEPDEDESKLSEYPVAESIYTEKMPENLCFAAAVAEFGMILRESEYVGNAECKDVLELLDMYEDEYEDDVYKDEFIWLVKTMNRRGY